VVCGTDVILNMNHIAGLSQKALDYLVRAVADELGYTA